MNNININRVSSIINNTTELKKYISNNNYSSILYLLVKKQFTYYTELKRMFNVSTNHHLFKMYNDGIIQIKTLTDEEWNFIKLNNNLGEKHKNKMTIYEFTKEALEYYTRPRVFELLQIFAKSGIDDYIILQKNKYKSKLLEIEERKEFNKLEFKQRYKIALLKKNKTAEDYAIIQMFENDN